MKYREIFMKLFTVRRNYFYAFVAIVLLLTMSMYLQYFRGMVPCALCISQRVMLACLGVLFFLGAIITCHKLYYKFIGSLTFIFALMGILLAGRQSWLQYFPGTNPNSCDVNLSYLLQALPFSQVLQKIFSGSAECSVVSWKLLYLSLPEWSLVCFIGFAIFSIFQCFNNNMGK